MATQAGVPAPEYIRKLPTPAYSEVALDCLTRGRVLAPGESQAEPGESPAEMIWRLLAAIDRVERVHFDTADRVEFVGGVAGDIADGLWTPGRPALTSLNRTDGLVRTGSSCTVLPRRHGGVAADYYSGNMGAGFDFSTEKHPDRALLEENEFSARAAALLPERPVSGMATLHVLHPRVRQFLAVKRDHPIEHFNTSLLLPTGFMKALEAGTLYHGTFNDGAVTVDPRALMSEIVDHIWHCGNPGVLFIDRIDRADPTPALGLPRATAPCGEATLRPFEVCFFASLDLDKFVGDRPEDLQLDRLTGVVTRMVRALDDIADASLGHYPSPLTDMMIKQRRQIGIGVCGYSNLGVRLRLPYASKPLLELLRTALRHVSLVAQAASTDLAGQRKSFAAFGQSRFVLDQHFLNRRLPLGDATHLGHHEDVMKLRRRVAEVGSRHASIITFPPQATVAELLNTSAGLAPWFSVYARDGQLKPLLCGLVRSVCSAGDAEATLSAIAKAGTCDLPIVSELVREVVRTATQLSVAEQIAPLAEASPFVHQAISTTVNLTEGASPNDIEAAVKAAWEGGVKAVSAYRNRSLSVTGHGRSLL